MNQQHIALAPHKPLLSAQVDHLPAQRARSTFKLLPNVKTRYVRCALVLHEFCVVALSKHTHVTGMTQRFQNCAQIYFKMRNGS